MATADDVLRDLADDGDPGPIDPEARNSAPAPKQPHWLAEAWCTIASRGDSWLDAEPPPRAWLLMRGDKPLLERMAVALFVGPGGRGKTFALVDLAIAIATGRRWLGAFDVPQPGRVVLALGEEDEGELRRRLHPAASDLNEEERFAAKANIIAMGLRGADVSLIRVEGDLVTTTDTYAELVQRVSEFQPSIVLLDPLARWAPGCESNNVAATRAIQSLEYLAIVANASVLVAHHTNKVSRAEGGDGAHASSARGVTGLTDAVRLVMELTGKGEDDLELAVKKFNNGPPHDPLPLARGAGGVLRVRTDAAGNVVERVDDRQRRTDAAVEALVEPCIRAVIEHGPCSQNTIEEVVRADGKRVRKALERAVLAKRLTRVPGARNALVYSYVGSTAVGVE